MLGVEFIFIYVSFILTTNGHKILRKELLSLGYISHQTQKMFITQTSSWKSHNLLPFQGIYEQLHSKSPFNAFL